jgi:Putative zinc-finger/WD40-like Beta Propeller Repeat
MTRGPRDHVEELISASLSGELTELERGELNEHLASCPSCRETLAAFSEERRLLSGLGIVAPPRDLAARVNRGIESGRAGLPWWRRQSSMVAIGATLATVAAAVLAVVFLSNLPIKPVGQTGSPNPSASVRPSTTGSQSASPSSGPTAAPALALGPGQLGYLSLNGGSFEVLRLTLVNDATGASLPAGTASGPPIAASLSPDGSWLAYITRKGESGGNETWALRLSDGKVVALGCSLAAPFTDRLAWSPDGRYLAYTLVGIDLGPSAGCQASTGGTDVWLFDTRTSSPRRFTTAGYAYAAAFDPTLAANGPRLWVSFAMPQPQSALLGIVPDATGIRQTFDQQPGVFLPLFSPDGNRALFWRGSMTSEGGSWRFSQGGMPQLSGDFRSTGPASAWIGGPIFADLVPVGGEAFASGSFAWGPDSDLLAFWNGAWTGAPQSSDGAYPSQREIYVGRISNGLLTAASRLGLSLGDGERVENVILTPDGSAAVVTVGQASAGIGDPPSALLESVPLAGGPTRKIGGDAQPPPWNGPAVFGH